MVSAEDKQRKKKNGTTSHGFKNLGLSEDVFNGICRMGFRVPTPVQRKAIPVILTGTDSVVMARTGSGKTIAFLVPLMEKLLQSKQHGERHGVGGVIISPTRELSLQTLRVFHKLAADTELRIIGIHGGEGMEKQFHLLASKPDVIVATPGRLAHHLSEIPDFSLSQCRVTVLDEADRLIEMGFAGDIRAISKTLPESNQKVLLSATMPKVLVEFTKTGFCVDPTVVRLDQEASVSAELRIAFITCRSQDKDATLLHVLQKIRADQADHAATRTGLTLIFAATRHHVEYVSHLLEASGTPCTMIYGTLDHEARKSNLAAFRSGKSPVLVVTDVAARGIDVPLIDHVIHYHFPPTPKLFVHRSGRAARAGRIGYCWGLVEPDELPYMIDLHLFLGRRPSTGQAEAGDDKATAKDVTYTLDEMTPDMVHYGAVPELELTQEVENVERLQKSELCGSQRMESLRSLTKVCTNAMKQYRSTRTEASREGVRRAKEILEGRRLETGQRIGCGIIPSHPLLLSGAGTAGGKGSSLTDAQNLKKREEFLRALSGFRPKESVFEAFAAGKAKDAGVVSHVDKGRTTSKSKTESSAALSAMREMRRQMRISRDKGKSLVIAGSDAARDANSRYDDEHSHCSIEETDAARGEPTASPAKPVPATLETKRRLSKAERRRLKKNPKSSTEELASMRLDQKSKKAMRGSDFRDSAYYIGDDRTIEDGQRSRHVEAAMQPTSTSATKGSLGHALRIEEAMLDIIGDENDELVKRQRLMRWDKSKRKYVMTTVGSELSQDSKSKKMRLESGQLVRNDDKKKLGELYEKWQKKTNRSVGRNGVFDDADDSGKMDRSRGSKKVKKGDPRSQRVRHHGDDQEVKSLSMIKKERQQKQNARVKNMKKSERKSLEGRQHQKRRDGGRHR